MLLGVESKAMKKKIDENSYRLDGKWGVIMENTKHWFQFYNIIIMIDNPIGL